MDHSGHDMAMGSMSAGAGIPPLLEFPKFYYAVVGSAVGVGTLVHIYNHFLYRQRYATAVLCTAACTLLTRKQDLGRSKGLCCTGQTKGFSALGHGHHIRYLS